MYVTGKVYNAGILENVARVQAMYKIFDILVVIIHFA